MPIYAYRCSECGHAKDVLQKMSDPVLNLCPACGAQAFTKQVTAAGFQLKGSGWYVTDFRGGDKPAAKAADDAKGAPATTDAAPAPAAAAKTDSAAPAAPVAAPVAAPAPAAPAAGSK
ncbi:MAG: zinc ribbon domain-containing protein [Telluria sp.]|nr:zinc ribbon domain-containing protein [Telluria sp.]